MRITDTAWQNFWHGIDLRPHQPWMTVGHPQREMKLRLSRLGYKLANTYGDGIINMRDSSGIMVFVREDGTVSKPRTVETMVAQSVLWTAGITCSDGKRVTADNL